MTTVVPAYEKDFELEYSSEYGLYLRIGSTDKSCVKEVYRDYKKMQLQDKVVMDLGGCFGAFCRFALDSGAKHVYTYEPEPKNIPLLQKNTQGMDYERITTYNKAVIAGNDQTVDLYRGGRRGHSMESASTLEIRGREKIQVGSCNFEDELKRIKPSVIKMDVEGGEYSLLEIRMPKYVKEIMVEYHFKRKALKEKCAELHNYLLNQNFKAIEAPYLEDKNRHGLGLYRRT